MNRSVLKSRKIKVQHLCAGLLLSVVALPSMALEVWYRARVDLPIVPISNEWTCPFAQPDGADDWYDFSPFTSLSISMTTNFRWNNGYAKSTGLRIEVPTMARPSGNGGYYDTGGPGNKAVIQAMYAVLLNRHTPMSGMSVDPRGPLVNVLVPAANNEDSMRTVINTVRNATGIDDGGNGSIDQLAAGLQAGVDYYLSCAPGGRFGSSSSQIFTSTGFMGNIDVGGFTDLLFNGTVMILQTNKLVWNASRNAWGYGEDGFYLVKGMTQQFSTSGVYYSYTLYDVATGATKSVVPHNPSIRNVWSTGKVSGSHRVMALGDGNSDYTEVILGFAGMDPLVNHY